MQRSLHGFQIKNNNIDTLNLKYRVMHISIHADTVFHIINVYAQAKHHLQIPFYEVFYKYISKFKNQNLIILGDRLSGLQWYDEKI